jgi:hypothetical protein
MSPTEQIWGSGEPLPGKSPASGDRSKPAKRWLNFILTGRAYLIGLTGAPAP